MLGRTVIIIDEKVEEGLLQLVSGDCVCGNKSTYQLLTMSIHMVQSSHGLSRARG